MTYDAFRELVRQMREAQNRYFKSRDPEALTKARELERSVDNAVTSAGRVSLFEESKS